MSLHPFARRLIVLSPVAAPPLLQVSSVKDGSNNGTAPPSDLSPLGGMNTHFSPSMAIILVVLLSAFFFMGFFSIYVRRCTTDDDFNNPNAAGAAGARRDRPPQGLDPAVVESLPLVTYSAVKHRETTECVVCLTDFDENDSLRQLPKCKHCFHPDCIDMWLYNHTTCPLCRRSLLDRARSFRWGSSRGSRRSNEGSSSSRGSRHLNEDGSRREREAQAAADGLMDEGAVTVVAGTTILQMGNFQEVDLSTESPNSPILGVVSFSSSSTPGKGRGRELRRSHSTGHSLLKRALSRGNFLPQASSDEVDGPSSSCFPMPSAGLHRSRSQATLSLSEEEMKGAPEQLPRSTSRGWISSFKRTFSVRSRPQEAVAATMGDSSTSSRRAFERLGV